MDKSAEAFLSIGEMCKRLSLGPHILRYWEEQFPMLKPLKRAGGRRHYRPDDVAMLYTINRLLNQEGYTIKGACKYLRMAKNVAPNGTVIAEASPAESHNVIPIAALKSIRNRLSDALKAA